MTVRITPLPEQAAPLSGAGLGALATERGNLPLETVDVRAAITGLNGRVELSQGFRNPFDVPLEAVYIFPLPDRAAVTRMRMETADGTVEAALKERGRARADYQEAVAAGHRAALAEEDRPDVFTMQVGNIPPGERVTVRLTLDQPLPYEDGAATFRFPLVVAPRYIPGTALPDERAGDGIAADTDAVPDASRISPPVLLPGFPDPVRLSLEADIDPAGFPLGEIRSSLHVVAADTRGSGRTTVRLQPGERLDRDFVLRLAYGRPEQAAASVTLTPDAEGESGTFTLTVLPPSEQCAPRPRDVVILLDRSGSMHGWKMVAARRAAARIVDTLTGRDRFAVLSFDDMVERPAGLDGGLSPATDRNRFRAVEHLAGLQARGGTELAAPLREGAALLDDAGRDRVLVLITDGQVGNEDQLLALIDPFLNGLRIHAVGIDQAVNAGFLGRLATAGQGRLELVESEDRLDEAMEHIHHRINAPLLTGLSLEWSGVRVEPGTLTPPRPGAVFPGVPLVVAGRYLRAADDCSLTVRAVTGEGAPWQCRAVVSRTEAGAATSVWARAHLRDLEDRYAVTGGRDLEQQIVETSLRFGVLCRFTAFVAIDDRAVAGGPAHRVVQPVESPAGWPLPAPPVAAASSPAMPAMPMAAPAGPLPPPPAGPAPLATPPRGLPPRLRRPRGPAPSPSAAAPSAPRPSPVPALVRQELNRLQELAAAARPERRRHLSDLRTRLLGLAQHARSDGLPADRLTALADALQAADDPAQQSRLDELWTLAVGELTAFLDEHTATPKPPRRPFWKKPS
ncbi:VIT domain-containing protein [Thermomonospora sp. CIF 1]|uniref:VIT domain-containing protein n=1 Tax=Thermomonospora sp. CIF 1 TaxID=1916083 RepID=UPI000A6ACFC8|nr:VIT domain-containing protein [Thermomonospora sp. CIF 1]PKK12256.1 MAG: trypsin [Thermomonospora sp. CIF 1]